MSVLRVVVITRKNVSMSRQSEDKIVFLTTMFNNRKGFNVCVDVEKRFHFIECEKNLRTLAMFPHINVLLFCCANTGDSAEIMSEENSIALHRHYASLGSRCLKIEGRGSLLNWLLKRQSLLWYLLFC